MGILGELKRRNVIRVAVLYVVSSWLILQAAELLFEALTLPEWSLRLVLALLLLGFPLALVFSWVYELTPEGLKRESEVPAQDSVTAHTAKKLDIAVIALIVVAIGFFAYVHLVREEPATVTRADAAAPSPEPASPATRPMEEADPLPNRGVAILPFDNLSSDAENAFFASGVHEDILTYLSRVQDLRIISRTSVEKYAETDLDMRQIAQELGVSHIVEGSVRRAGDRVRVTVQLIEAATDQHLWADNYDRTLDDIFAIQTEIANAIVGELKAQLTGNAAADFARLRTTNTEAYDLYLRARVLEREGNWDFVEQIETLEEAVAIDPEFVSAWLLLGESCGWQVWFYNDPDGEYLRCARQAVSKVEALVPGTPEAAAARGHFLYQVEKDFRGALQALEPIAPQRPNDSQIAKRIMFAHYHLTHWEKALELGRRALQLDPNEQDVHLVYYHIQYFSGQFEAARATIEELVQRFPENLNFQSLRVQLLASGFGDLGPGIEWAQRIAGNPPEDALFITSNAAYLLYIAGKHEQSLELIRKNLDRGRLAEIYLPLLNGLNHRAMGNPVAAGESFEAAYHQLVSLMADRGTVEDALLSLRARLAARTDRADEARRYLQLTRDRLEEQRDPVVEPNNRYDLALTLADLGDIDAAWAELRPLIGLPPVTRWDLRFDPELKRFFGHLPEYQVIVADLESPQSPDQGNGPTERDSI